MTRRGQEQGRGTRRQRVSFRFVIEQHTESALLVGARQHDEAAFRALVEPHGRHLKLLCYRMLGSLLDAEDASQETLLKAWRGLRGYDGQASVRTWLSRIATNTCLDMLRSRKRRVLPPDVAPPITSSWTEPAEWGTPGLDIPWLEPYPDNLLPQMDPAAQAELRESVSLAYVRALQLLPPRQRAALILRDVLEWPARDVADALDTTVAAVNSALQRARATTRSARGSLSDTALGQHRAGIATRFVRAWEDGDVDLLLSLLTEDAVVMMPPMFAWFQGIETLRPALAHSWGMDPRPGVFRVQVMPMNGQLGFAFWYRPYGDGGYTALDIVVLTLDPTGQRVREMTSFVKPELFDAVGLPRELPPLAS
ncbi:MAG: RNA polymerase subunit sigma-70 [Chloroflexota bacterium]